ncbi:unnamed protein product [Auanema sp. JU1783]|nr:unnamed protein product [Auanema sp. JU1783]
MNIFLTNLACADLLILLFCLPPTVLNDVTKTFWLSTFFCKSMIFIQNTSVYVSIISLVFITFERWRAITCPLKRPVKSTRYVIAGTWIISLLLSLPEPVTVQLQYAEFDRQSFRTTWGTQCRETWSASFQRNYQIVQALLSYFFPLMFIICLCFKMTKTLNYCQLSMGRRQVMYRRKAVRMLIAVVCLFAISYLPVHLYNISLAFELLTTEASEEWIAFRKLIPRVFSYSSSCLNPVLYNFMCESFRSSFAQVMFCRKGKCFLSRTSSTSPDEFHTEASTAAAGLSSTRRHRSLSDRRSPFRLAMDKSLLTREV